MMEEIGIEGGARHKGSVNNNQLVVPAKERERELRVLIELRGKGEGSRILRLTGGGGGETGEGGDGAHPNEVEGRR